MLGSPVRSISNGRVTQVGNTAALGNYIVIAHDLATPITVNGITTSVIVSLYAHLRYALTLGVGDLVDIGQQIGQMGATGDTGGAVHLHFEIRLGLGTGFQDPNGYNQAGAPLGWVDPTDFINGHRTLGGLPDLDVYLTPALSVTSLGAGGLLTIDYNAVDYGSVGAPASVSGIYLSTNATISSSDLLIGTDWVGPISAGYYRHETTQLVLPSNLAGGNYYVGIITDYNGQISEENESNNASSGVLITVFTAGADTLTLPTGNKTWHSLGGNDTITGTSSRDTIYGDGGNDSLIGGGGNDVLVGGAGYDRLVGGTGYDIFDFNAVSEIGKAAGVRDVIRDFNGAYDYIDLSTIDANSSTAANDAFKFVDAPGTTFTGVKGQLRWFQYDPTGTANDKTIVMGDVDGDRVADFQIELTGLHTMRGLADFYL